MTEDYKSTYNKFDIVREILANRYMLTSLLVNINNLCYFLEGKEKAIQALLSEESKQKIKKTIKYKNEIEFDMFKISGQYYNALVKRYGAEAVTNACIMLDSYIKDNIINKKQPSQFTINRLLKEYTQRCKTISDTKDYLAEATRKANQVDYKLIDDETLARQYIASIPFYMRAVNEGCKYLYEKFNIKRP